MMLLDTRNKNIGLYSLEMENSTVFKIEKIPLIVPPPTPVDDDFKTCA
jgi:hypothetical protein